MSPLIGMPLCFDDRGRWKPTRNYHYIDGAYAVAVENAGGTPIYLPLQADASELVDRLDGLLLPGGDDLPPPRAYPGVDFDLVPDAQLEFDTRVLARALDRAIPVLAICYGMQLLALAAGGRLHYDIPTDLPEAGPHRLAEADGRHPLHVEKGTRLAGMLGGQSTGVNSLHHQGVATPGAGMRVCARAGDGLIEAIERDSPGFCVGVQWHPEKMAGDAREALFEGFIEACAR